MEHDAKNIWKPVISGKEKKINELPYFQTIRCT